MVTKTRPCIVLYKATGNPREKCDEPIGMAGFCIASFLKLQSGNKNCYFCLHSNKGLQYKFTSYTTYRILIDTKRTMPLGAKYNDYSLESHKTKTTYM